MARTWKDKHDHHKHPAHVERLNRAYAGLPDGASIVIATPKEMSAYFRKVPRGKTRSMDDLRGALAKKHGVSAPINERIVALVHEVEARGAGSPKLSAEELWRAVAEGAR